jgi:hypothetical protein
MFCTGLWLAERVKVPRGLSMRAARMPRAKSRSAAGSPRVASSPAARICAAS